MLQDLLKEYLTEDSKVEEFLNKMKENKIYTSNEENIDTRYSKLKGQFDELSAKDKESQSLIEELKKSSEGNEGMKSKISEYEAKIQQLEAENQQLAIDKAVETKLLSAGAKASDIDYLVYKIKQGGTELKLDKDGNIKGLDDLVKEMSKTYSGNFEEKAKKKVDVVELPEGNKEAKITKEQFQKMGYQERNKLYNENKELYTQLVKGDE